MTPTEQAPLPQVRRTNQLAIAALVCGIVSILLFPAGIMSIILGNSAHRQIRQTGDDGYGLAKAGLILGYIGIVLGLIGLVAPLLIGLSSRPGPVGP